MIDINECRICGGQDLAIAYEGPMRVGGVHSSERAGFRIIRCSQCGIEFLHPFPIESVTSYVDGTYWKKKTGKQEIDLENIKRKAEPEQILWIKKIGIERFRGRTVVDLGCGCGAFLDQIKDVSSLTVGIEPDLTLATAARKSGHHVYHTFEEAIEAGLKADILVSFDTLEHMRQPEHTVRLMKDIVHAEGEIYLGVPNQRDFMKSMTPAYLPHFYHLAHIWYFSAESLDWLFRTAGLHVKSTVYVHKYNFMNLVEWVRTGKAPGNPASDLVDMDLDSRICSWLEDRGSASHILVRAMPLNSVK